VSALFEYFYPGTRGPVILAMGWEAKEANQIKNTSIAENFWLGEILLFRFFKSFQKE
jgi:hypothetical protein